MSEETNIQTPEESIDPYFSKAQTVDDIVRQYAGKILFTPASRRNYRQEALNRFASMDTKPVIYTPETVTKPDITYDEYRVQLWEGFKMLKKTANLSEIKFHPKNASETIPNVIRYMIGSDQSSYSLTKGLWIWGRFGSGKTDFVLTLLRVHNTLASRYSNLSKIKIVSYNAIYEQCRSEGNTEPINKMIKGYTFIDDFFYQERSAAKIFGNTDNIAELVITRIDQLHKSGYSCLVTSNYDLDTLSSKFDLHPGSISRLSGSFNFIPWHGDDMRK